MGMVPCATVLCRSPGIGDRVSRSSRALGDGWDTVHLVGVVLADSMEVQARAVVLQTVVQCDDF